MTKCLDWNCMDGLDVHRLCNNTSNIVQKSVLHNGKIKSLNGGSIPVQSRHIYLRDQTNYKLNKIMFKKTKKNRPELRMRNT